MVETFREHTRGQSRSHALASVAMLAVVLLTAAGCGNGLARVSGQVTLDGQPIAAGEDISATICFYPEGGTGSPAVGRLDANGKYHMSTGAQTGIAPGKYTVTIRASEFGKGDPNAPRPSRLITPRMYNNPGTSGLQAEVASGSNTLDFDMTTPPRQAQRGRR